MNLVPTPFRRSHVPGKGASIAGRVVAAIVAVVAVSFAILGTDGLHQCVGRVVLFGADVGDGSPGEGDVRQWGRLALAALALVAIMIRGVWADFLVGLCGVLVVAAFIGHGQDVSEVARLTETQAKEKAEKEAAKAKEKEDAAKAKDGPVDVVGEQTRFSLPTAKLQPPGEALARGDVKVLVVVAERADDDAVLRRETRQHEATLRVDVPAAGAKKAVPVDVDDDAAPALAADLTGAEAIYLVGGP